MESDSDMCVLVDVQIPGDALNGCRPKQHRQDAASVRRPRAVPHLPDPPGSQGKTHTRPPATGLPASITCTVKSRYKED